MTTNDNGTWHVRYNQLYQLYKEQNTAEVVKARKLRWLGYLFKSKDMNLCRKLNFTKPENMTGGKRV
jgi:hypothetical protein